uniref:Eukaryotic translation initiation factor 2A n=1 Tax=Panagrolaimus sp. JU765 TaxID=591449 RepID=A0AC34R963_9BILA
MSSTADNICYALRGAFGVQIYQSLNNPTTIYERQLTPPDDVRSMTFSSDGKYFAYCDSKNTFLVDVENKKDVLEYELPKPTFFCFSPKNTLLMSWEPYVIYGLRRDAEGKLRTPNPNLNFFSVKEGKHVGVVIAKTKEEIAVWTQDEKYLVRIDGSQVLVNDGLDFRKLLFKTVISGVRQIELSPNTNQYLFAAFIPAKNEPSKVEIRSLSPDMKVLKTLTLMRCDKINMWWNARGSHLLVMNTEEVDKSNQSYYGMSFLNLMPANGETVKISLDKNGPISDVKWNPEGSHFATAYGFMPAKVGVFNLAGNRIWDLGEGPRNEIHFNPQGNLMVTSGFGSLAAGRIQIWNFSEQKEINMIEVPNTTHFSFSPDGQHFSTVIAAPRMRVDNSYRLWHFTGKQLFEFKPEKYELWELQFRKISAAPKKFAISELSQDEKIQTGVAVKLGDGQQVAAGAIKKSSAYVPPHKRKDGCNKGALQPAGTGTVVIKSEKEEEKEKLENSLKEIENLKKKLENGEELTKKESKKIKQIENLKKKLENGGELTKKESKKIKREAEFQEKLSKLSQPVVADKGAKSENDEKRIYLQNRLNEIEDLKASEEKADKGAKSENDEKRINLQNLLNEIEDLKASRDKGVYLSVKEIKKVGREEEYRKKLDELNVE